MSDFPILHHDDITLRLGDFAGVLFDLDGTLVDTMPLHHRAYRQVLAKRGVDLTWATFMEHVGPPAATAIPLFAAAAGLDLPPDEIVIIHGEKKIAFETILASVSPTLLPTSGLLGLIGAEQACGLVTSGNRRGVQAILQNLGWTDAFGTIVTGDDVNKGKPDPAPYLLAAERLQVKPQDCIAFEDTADGLASARAAGMRTCDVRASTWPSTAS